MPAAVLTIDIGLTNCKTTLFDLQGGFIDAASSRYPSYSPQTGWSEQDPEDWFQAIHSCLVELRRESALETFDILTISITAHMHGLIAVDRSGTPVIRCWTLWDRRSVQEALELAENLGEGTAYQITGGRMEPYTPACKILWLKKHQPEVFDHVAMFLSPKDFLRIRMGGDWVTDPIDASGTVLFDLRKKKWSPLLVEACGAHQDMLPEVRLPWEKAGFLSLGAAQELGIPAGIPLLVGSGDDIEVLGAGVYRPGLALEHLGSTGTLVACVSQPIFDPEQRVEVYPHVLPNLYLVGGATNAAGRSLEWANNLLRTGQDPCGFLPLDYPPQAGSLYPPIFLPYIQGERGLLWDPNSSGMLFGLKEVHTVTAVATAVYEGVGFSIKELLEGANSIGADIQKVVSGTPYNNPKWAQMRADLYGLPVLFTRVIDPTALGAALLALYSLKVITDFEDTGKTCSTISARIEPNLKQVEYFRERYKTYEMAVSCSKPMFSIF
jgi:xylulokinase